MQFLEDAVQTVSDIRTNVVRHSHECRATVVRIKMEISYIRGKVVRHSHECRATVVRQSRDIFSKLDKNSQICRINIYSMRQQHESCVYIVNLCREIVANYLRTSLQLSHSSEIGALQFYLKHDRHLSILDAQRSSLQLS